MKRIAAVLSLIALSAGPAHAGKPTRLTFPQVVARAQANPLARAAREKTHAAEAQADEAHAARWGKLQVTSFLAPSPRIKCDDPTCTSTSPKDVTINVAGVFGGVKVEVVQPLYTFGKLSSISEAAHQAAEAAQLSENVVAGNLVELSAKAYYGLKLARELVWMLEDGLDEITKGQKQLEEKLAEGSPDVTIQDKLRLETLRAEVEARLTEAHEAEATALAGLRALVGDDTIDIDEEQLEAVAFDLGANADDYVARAASGRSDLRAARHGAQAAAAMADFQRAQWWPDLVVVGGVNFAAAQGVENAPSAFYNDPFNTLGAQLGLALRWTLDPASQRARVRKADADSRRADALVAAANLGATLEVRRAYAKALQAKKRLESTEKGEKAAKGWVASVLQADAIGVISAKDMADALVAYFTLKGRVLQTTFDWNLATVSLRRAVGEFTAARARP